MPRPLVVGIGEVLWDMLPSGKQLGGAPANFAYHANALGADGTSARSDAMILAKKSSAG